MIAVFMWMWSSYETCDCCMFLLCTEQWARFYAFISLVVIWCNIKCILQSNNNPSRQRVQRKCILPHTQFPTSQRHTCTKRISLTSIEEECETLTRVSMYTHPGTLTFRHGIIHYLRLHETCSLRSITRLNHK